MPTNLGSRRARRAGVIELRPKDATKRDHLRRPKSKTFKLPPEPDPAQVQHAFRSMAASFATVRNVADAENIQLAAIQELLKPKTAFTLRVDPAGGRLRVSTVRGRNDQRVAAAIPGEGPIGLAFQGRLIREDGLIAISLGSNPIGCLVILAPRLSATDNLLAALAAQTAAAIQVAELNDDMSRRTKDLETAVAGLKSIERGREKLLTNVSQELKNPLTTIKAYLAMLEGEKLGALSPRQQHALAICHQNSERLHRMINELLLISRLEAGQMALSSRPFGLKGLAKELIEELAPSAAKSEVRLSLRGSEVFIRGDRSHLADALRNVLQNAVDSSPRSTTVEVELSSEHGIAQLSVSDRGTTPTTGALEHIFDSIHRTTREGRHTRHDLSLPVAAKIVRLHGGRVAAAPRSPNGSTLTIYLPAFATAVSQAILGVEASPGGVLIVEDDDDCREVLKEVLEEEGYPVLTAASAQAAKELLAEIRPALVLLDLRLSDDDGRVVLKYIRSHKNLAPIPVYIISGASDGPAIAAQKGGDRVDGFFEKPIQLAKLLSTIASIVQPRRRGNSPSKSGLRK